MSEKKWSSEPIFNASPAVAEEDDQRPATVGVMADNLESEIFIAAPPEQVWPLVSDLRRMPQWSPQCRKVIARGPIRRGTFMLNVNRDGNLWWPTRAKVTDFHDLQRVAFRVLDNGTTWSFTLTPQDGGTVLTQRRDVPPSGTSKVSALLVDKVLGGEDHFEANLVAGMNTTLQRIRAAVEARSLRA